MYMPIFSTKLKVKKELTNELFTEMAVEWINGSDKYEFEKIEAAKSIDAESKDGKQSLRVTNYGKSVLVRFNNDDNGISWINDYIFASADGYGVLSVQLYRNMDDLSVRPSRRFHRPYLFKQIVNNGYCMDDGDLVTNDKAIVIDAANIETALRLMKGESGYELPVVYVTPYFKGGYALDCKELAKDLAGSAHVVTEQDSSVTSLLRSKTDGNNPYNGAVWIFFGKGEPKRMLRRVGDDGNSFREKIMNEIFGRLNSLRVEDDFLYDRLQRKIMNEEVDVTKEILKETEEKNEQLENENKELTDKNNILQNKTLSMEYMVESQKQRSKSGDGKAVLDNLCYTETEFYPDEVKDIVLSALQKRYEQMKDDENLKGRRSFHVISDILEHNSVTDNPSIMKNELRGALKNGMMSATAKAALKGMGFEIEDDGTHFKIVYKGDDRYRFSVSRTPSDGRSNKNTISDILLELLS